jgi:four helix bundle protein
MAGVQKFEDLRVWREASAFCDRIGAVIQASSFQRDADLRAQLNRAALSTVANIAEGFLRGRRKEFVQFLRVASGSNGEARALLYAARGRKYLADEEAEPLIESTNVIGRMLRRLIESLESEPPSA